MRAYRYYWKIFNGILARLSGRDKLSVSASDCTLCFSLV